jgi:branched-chain amino acid transport system substrate-binding protein
MNFLKEENSMSKRYLLFSVLIAVSMILAACGGAAKAPEVCAENPDESVCAVIEKGSTIKIGYGGPMAGDYSAFGIDISQAGLLAIEDAGELEGFTFELLVEDTQGSGEGGASVANLFVSDPDVVAIAGHTFSGSTAAAIPIYYEARLPMLSPSATRADLTEGPQDVFNRIPFTDDLQGQFAAEYLFNVLGVTKLAVMHDGDAYGKGVAEKVQEVFMGLGGEVVAVEAVTPGETDYSAVLTDVGSADPEAIYFGGYYPECAVIAQGMPVAGMEDVILFSDDGSYGQAFIDLAGEYAEGVYAASGAPLESAAKAEFDAYYESVYGDAPGAISTFTWHGYDVVDALVQAVKSVAILGGDGNLYIPREALVAAVNGIKDYQGLTGLLTCNGGECNASGPSFQVVKDGAWIVP